MCMCCYEEVLARKQFSNSFTPLPANPQFQQQPRISGGQQPTSQQKELYGSCTQFLMFKDTKSIGSGCWLPHSILEHHSENRSKWESFHQPWKSHQWLESRYKQPSTPINVLVTLSSLISHVSVRRYRFVISKVVSWSQTHPFFRDAQTSTWF